MFYRNLLRTSSLVITITFASLVPACAPSEVEEEEGDQGFSLDAVDPDKYVVMDDMVVRRDLLTEEAESSAGSVAPSSAGIGPRAFQVRLLLRDRIKWPNGVVPYAFSSSTSALVKGLFAAAKDEWQARTPVTFRPRRTTDKRS